MGERTACHSHVCLCDATAQPRSHGLPVPVAEPGWRGIQICVLVRTQAVGVQPHFVTRRRARTFGVSTVFWLLLDGDCERLSIINHPDSSNIRPSGDATTAN